MSLTLSAVYEEILESEGGGYVAYAEELPGAISEGDTLEEARENLRDAIEILLAANRELASKSHHGKRVAREKMTGSRGLTCEASSSRSMHQHRASSSRSQESNRDPNLQTA